MPIRKAKPTPKPRPLATRSQRNQQQKRERMSEWSGTVKPCEVAGCGNVVKGKPGRLCKTHADWKTWNGHPQQRAINAANLPSVMPREYALAGEYLDAAKGTAVYEDAKWMVEELRTDIDVGRVTGTTDFQGRWKMKDKPVTRDGTDAFGCTDWNTDDILRNLAALAINEVCAQRPEIRDVNASKMAQGKMLTRYLVMPQTRQRTKYVRKAVPGKVVKAVGAEVNERMRGWRRHISEKTYALLVNEEMPEMPTSSVEYSRAPSMLMQDRVVSFYFDGKEWHVTRRMFDGTESVDKFDGPMPSIRKYLHALDREAGHDRSEAEAVQAYTDLQHWR